MNRARFFNASCIALIVTSMSFALRGGAMGAWTEEFGLSNAEVGWVTGTAFWGFTLAMVFGGPLCDIIGMGRIAAIATLGHIAGILLTCFAWDFWSLYFGTLLFGIANGSVEAACNPLIATLYPDNKTTKLNQFHVWFPGGIVIGGLLAFGLGEAGIGWRWQFATMLLPTVIYAFMFVGQKFPQTERVQSGVSTGEMFKACCHPLFLILVAGMLLTAATELGPGQWIPGILTNAGVSGILVLVWITGLMAVGRQFAGAFVHRLSPVGMLIGSAAISTVGLFFLSKSSGSLIFVAATVFAIGVCFFWPTMLGFVSERLPKTGALGLAIMGGAGMLSVSLVLPLIGSWYDSGIKDRLPEGQTVEVLSAAEATTEEGALWSNIQAEAGLEALGEVAILPLAVLAIFVTIALLDKRSRRLGQPDAPEPST
ncbi:MAG: MFS transporter [Verrucomicrobiota bacterium]